MSELLLPLHSKQLKNKQKQTIMKKFNLASLMFAAYTIFSDGRIVNAEGVEVKPNSKGLVTLVTSEATKIGKKDYAKGAEVVILASTVLSWVEPTDWVSVPLTDDQKKAIREKRKEIKDRLDGATQEMLKNFGKPEFNTLAGKVNDINLELEAYNKENPTSAETKAKTTTTRVFTPEEQAAIDAHTEAVEGVETAEKAVKTAKELVKTTAAGLPKDYKPKKNGGLKAPAITDDIRVAMYHDHKVGKMKMAEVARKYGYSSSYCNLIVNGSKTYTKSAEETKVAYDKVGATKAGEFAKEYVLILA